MMNKMIDPRTCINFRVQDVCPNANQEIMAYLDNRVITDMKVSFTPEMFDKAFEYCATCAHYAPFAEIHEQGQTVH
jgi:hypothetical protein